MSVSFKVEDVDISAIRDRAMFNTFAGNQSYVIEGVGDELEVSYSSSSFVVSLGTGEAVICGGSMVSEGTSDTVTLGANESGYLAIEIDLAQTGTNICQFKQVATLIQQNINNGTDLVYDFPLYQYQTSSSGIQNMVDLRNIKSSLLGGASFSVEDGYVWVTYMVDGVEVKKKLGSLDPSVLTAVPSDVLSGKTFGGNGSDEAQTGTMIDRGIVDSTIGGLSINYPTIAIHKGANLQINNTSVSNEKLVSIGVPVGAWLRGVNNNYVGVNASELGSASVGDVRKNVEFSSSNGIKIKGTGTNIVNNARVVFVERHATGYGGTVTRTYNNSGPGIAILYASAGSNIKITSTGAGTDITPETVWPNDQDGNVRARKITEAGTVTYNLGINASYGIFIFVYI